MTKATSQGHEVVEDEEVEATERLVDVDNVVQPQPEVEALELSPWLAFGMSKTPLSWRDFHQECALNRRWATKACGGGCSFCLRTWRI